MTEWLVIRRGKAIATVEAPTEWDARVLIAERFGDGAWLMEAAA